MLATPARAWTFYCACPNRPKGEQRIAQAFRPGKAYEKKIALKRRPTFGRYSQKVTFQKATRWHFRNKNLRAQSGARETGHQMCNNISLGWRSISVRPPFQGDSVVCVVPRPEGLGYSLFALRATAECPYSRRRCLPTPGSC